MESDVVIWRNCSIGAPDAETDRDLLATCFIDNGCLEQIRDCKNSASIILGRTGAGKSATLIRLEQIEKNVIKINPIDLSFRYVENSTVIRFFRDAGVNLDVFYRLLWRHVLITELLRFKYRWDSQNAVTRWFDSVLQKLKRDPGKAKAVRYLQQWGDNFWQETEVRVQEVTEKVESDLKASVSSSQFAQFSFAAEDKVSAEDRREILSRGSSVVNKIQIKDLSKILDFLAEEVFEDDQDRVFITLDGLDESWVSSASKFHLIRALMEEIKTFRKIRNVKIIAVLRKDLLEKVYDETRDGGFQEEKYEAYYAPLRWREKDLERLVESRINEIFKRKYTNRNVTLRDVFPKDRGNDLSFSYLIDRTFLRPRDVISFVNECLDAAMGKPRITWSAMHSAEEKYSQKRFRSVLDEWTQMYPSLKHVTELLRGLKSSFSIPEILESAIDSTLLKVAVEDPRDELQRLASSFFVADSKVNRNTFLKSAMAVLYHVGMVGVKISATSPFEWAYREGRSFSPDDFNETCSLRIHKMFWREFGINSVSRTYSSE